MRYTELPGDTCVEVDVHSTGRGGCACSTLILIPCRTSLRNCCLARHLAGYTLSIYWFGMRYCTEPLRHGIARWIMTDSLPASLHSFRKTFHKLTSDNLVSLLSILRSRSSILGSRTCFLTLSLRTFFGFICPCTLHTGFRGQF